MAFHDPTGPERSYADTLAIIVEAGQLVPYLAALTHDSAKGVHAAQSELTCYALHCASDPASEVEIMAGAEVLARLAAEHGEGDDQIRLAGVLMKRAEHMLAQGQDERAKQFAVEAFLALEPLFEHGQPERSCGRQLPDHDDPGRRTTRRCRATRLACAR